MGHDVLLGLWCSVFGTLGAVWARRYVLRGPWREVAIGRVLRVWEPEPGVGWSKGVPAEVGYVDPTTRREVVEITSGGGGRAGILRVAWPGRQVVVFARARQREDFRISNEPFPPVDGYLSGCIASLVLFAEPLSLRIVFGYQPGMLSGAVGMVGLGFLALCVVRWNRGGRVRKALLACPERTAARVVAVIAHQDPDTGMDSDKTTAPVVSFTTDEGLRVTAVCGFHVATMRLRPGADVPVVYSASDPAVFEVDIAALRQ